MSYGGLKEGAKWDLGVISGGRLLYIGIQVLKLAAFVDGLAVLFFIS